MNDKKEGDGFEKLDKCAGCGKSLTAEEQGVGLCSRCGEEAATGALKLLDAEEREQLRAEGEDRDILLELKGEYTYPQFSEWMGADIAGVELKGVDKRHMVTTVYKKEGAPEQTMTAFWGRGDTMAMPAIMREYILYREWYSRLETEPCVDVLVYNEEKAEFALLVIDVEQEILLFPRFVWKAPNALVADWLRKRAEEAVYRTTFEFQDVRKWLDREITNEDLQPALVLNYADGLSICISSKTGELEERRPGDVKDVEDVEEEGKEKEEEK